LLQDSIRKILVEYLADNKIKYRDGDDDGTYLVTDSIHIRQFLERLWLIDETAPII
jgi:hypothetical protein